jgi:acyl-CoA synthetase (AMP-forming)/AMP-acid ligase II
VLQEDGYGQVVGRIKDMIIRGGENIFPKEIEQVLEQHSEILEAQVTIFNVIMNRHSVFIVLNLCPHICHTLIFRRIKKRVVKKSIKIYT